MTQIAFAGVGVDFGATRLFSDVSFTVGPGERWGIVGRNGTGKTTLFRLLTGDLEPTRGRITRAPGLRVSLLEQHRDYGAATTVWEAAAGELAELLALERSLVEQAANLAHDSSPRALARYGEDLERFEREGGYAVTARIDAVLHGLEFDPAQARERAVGGELVRGQSGRHAGAGAPRGAAALRLLLGSHGRCVLDGGDRRGHRALALRESRRGAGGRDRLPHPVDQHLPRVAGVRRVPVGVRPDRPDRGAHRLDRRQRRAGAERAERGRRADRYRRGDRARRWNVGAGDGADRSQPVPAGATRAAPAPAPAPDLLAPVTLP